MADVVQKIISGNNVKNQGNRVTSALPTGRFNSLAPVITKNTDLTLIDAKYDARFNKTYYEYNT